MRKRGSKHRLIYKNGRWYEDERWLPKKDYIFHADSNEGECIISCVTGTKYRIRDAVFI